MARLGGRGASFATLAVTLLLCAVVLEGAMRALGLAPSLTEYARNVSDPYLPFKPAPLSVRTGRSASDEFDYEYRHNSFGFRDEEHTLEKPTGVFRVLGIGDSFTYGVGAPFQDTYLARLQKMLNAREGDHPRVEIIKAGIPRFWAEPERILLDKYGREFSPDLILVGFLANDIVDAYFGMDAVVVDSSGFLRTREATEIGTIGLWLYQRSHLFRLGLRRYIDYRISRRFRPDWEDVFRDDGVHEAQWQALEAEYSRMLAISRELGSRLAIVYIPQRAPERVDLSYPPRRIAAWARARDVPFMNALEAMEGRVGMRPFYHERDGHCTPEGYAVVAKVIYDHLLRHDLIP